MASPGIPQIADVQVPGEVAAIPATVLAPAVAPVIKSKPTPVAVAATDEDPAPAHDAPAAREQPAITVACVARLKMVAGRARIYFGSGSSALDSAARDNALFIARLAEDCPEARIDVLGFADPTGSEEGNIRMSWKRANSVIDLMSANGFVTGQFTAQSHQETHGPDCMHFNIVDRRVEFDVSQAPG